MTSRLAKKVMCAFMDDGYAEVKRGGSFGTFVPRHTSQQLRRAAEVLNRQNTRYKSRGGGERLRLAVLRDNPFYGAPLVQS